jgi:hypothetical protein
MLDILKIKLIEAMLSLQQACTAAVIRDDDEDAGDIATPETRIDHEV